MTAPPYWWERLGATCAVPLGEVGTADLCRELAGRSADRLTPESRAELDSLSRKAAAAPPLPFAAPETQAPDNKRPTRRGGRNRR